jgi:phage tail-like protein
MEQIGGNLMTQFVVNPTRQDPYKNFKFQLKGDGSYVGGISKVGPLKRSTDVSSGRDKYEGITLERGLTQDPSFHDWAGSALGSEPPPDNLRRDISLEFYDDDGQLAAAYKIHRCWVSEYRASPGSDAIVIEHIKLENEGWEQDGGPASS